MKIEELDFGPYVPLFRIGAGGMGEVYAAKARQGTGTQQLVAVKRLFPRFGQDRKFVTMFLDEARIMGCVSHPRVVRILDARTDSDGSPYLVMELIVGADLVSLSEAIRPLPIDAALTWLAEAAEGLHAAHEARNADGMKLELVHRDVSPENVLVGIDGYARIGDFGVAYTIERMQQSTATGNIKGKFPYMSPEQTRAQVLDRRSDVFSLGVVAWEALVGRVLFSASNAQGMLDEIRHGTLTAPHTIRRDIPIQASDVIMRALARDAELRFSTALEFAQALRAARTREPAREELAELVRNANVVNVERIRTGLQQTWPAALTAMAALTTAEHASAIVVREPWSKTWPFIGLAALLAFGSICLAWC